jgi:molybdenum cofactor cytidylyltransferase
MEIMDNALSDINTCAIIILAAGNSSRLGKPKQLLPFNGKNLLQHSIDIAVESGLGPVLVVLGANYEMIQNEIQSQAVTVIVNNDWQEGMSTSIRCGINALSATFPAVDGALFMVCDQPYVSTFLLQEIIETQHKTRQPIVASSYAQTVGIPAFFHRSLFPSLLALKGDAGAKKIMQQNATQVATVFFELGNIDIDTLQDYTSLEPDK